MADKHLLKIGESIKNLIPGDITVEPKGDTSVVVSGEMSVGIKGIDINIEFSSSTLKIKCSRDYKYPIDEAASAAFQKNIIMKHHDYTIYSSGQALGFSKFAAYQEESELMNMVQDAINSLQDVVLTFEHDCVDFMEKNPDMAMNDGDEYDPEKNIELVNVDNSFKVVSTTEKDNDAYFAEHADFAGETFDNLCDKLGARQKNDMFKIADGDKLIACALNDDEITIEVSIDCERDTAAMYQAYVGSNFEHMICSYDENNGKFKVRSFVMPDKYYPEETEDVLNKCIAAVDACVHEYKDTLEKKDSSDFAADVQSILIEQTASLAEREEELNAKMQFFTEKEAELAQREQNLNQQIYQLQDEKANLEQTINAERERIRQKEEEMAATIKEYEDKNTKDILNIQQLANQVAKLQNAMKQMNNGSGGGTVSDEEVVRLKTKVQQLVNQKIVLEKKLTEKITLKDSQIKELSDTIRKKEMEIRKIESGMDDSVKSMVEDEKSKTAAYIKELECKVAEAGHVLTPEDMIDYLTQFYPDTDFKKLHSKVAKFVVFTDGSLEIRVRFGETNYVDVSKEAALKDQSLRKLNSKHGEVKFFSKDNLIIARKYFSKTAEPEDVDDVMQELFDFFAK